MVCNERGGKNISEYASISIIVANPTGQRALGPGLPLPALGLPTRPCDLVGTQQKGYQGRQAHLDDDVVR